jgi:hypothetical protein
MAPSPRNFWVRANLAVLIAADDRRLKLRIKQTRKVIGNAAVTSSHESAAGGESTRTTVFERSRLKLQQYLFWNLRSAQVHGWKMRRFP